MCRFKLTFAAYCCILSFCMLSCSEQLDYMQEVEQYPNGSSKTCSVEFDVSFQDFDASSVTRSNSDWNEGDKVYLKLGKAVYGIAELVSGSWVLNYYGEFIANESGSCIAYYFENSETETSSIVDLNYDTASYKATDGKYSYDGTMLSVTVNLKPLVGRIRFAGTPDSTISIIGITRYSSFSIQRDTLMPTTSPVVLTVQSDGYTPYIYGFFTSQDEPRLNIMTGESGFNRKFPNTIFKTGESGWINIPMIKSHNGWEENLYFEVDGIGFKMIPIKYNSTVFFLAETELTNALYNAVTESYLRASEPNKPCLLTYYKSDCIDFLEAINIRTGINFRLPTLDEWQFAAKGGELSHGYKYSGSDVISEVAWHIYNSDEIVHEVAQLMPNELGLYDMSGNYYEWTSSTDNDLGYYCGGAYSMRPEYCEVMRYSNATSTMYDVGLRLALSIN